MGKKEIILTNLKELSLKAIAREEGITGERKVLVEKLITGLLQPTIPPKELNLTYATIKYWEKKGFFLISNAKETDEWRKFSFLEYLWIDLLKKIVSMGCSIEIILPKVIFAFKNSTNPNDTVVYKADQKEESDPLNFMLVYKFLAFVISVYEKKGRASLHLFDDNTCLFTTESGTDKISAANVAYASMYKTGISICISDIFFKEESDREKRILYTSIFTPEEVGHKASGNKKGNNQTKQSV